jgi:histidine ammonia-lyase
VVFGPGGINVDDVASLARGRASAALSEAPAWRRSFETARGHLERRLQAGSGVYGVTTGVGASVGNHVTPENRTEMGAHLPRLHGCGTGRILEEDEAAAVVATRLATLARGCSGVRFELLERLCLLLNRGVLPRIPAEGSVGASGDLTPLSYLAAIIAGERDVTCKGEVMPAAEALERLRVAPMQLEPRESLALMNGTSAMTGLACLAYERARTLASLATSLTSMVSETTHGNPQHFDARIFQLKAHPGSLQAAQWIREHLGDDAAGRPVARLQDRYSLRCAPHVIGVLLDCLETVRRTLDIELNGVDDNPIIDPERGDVLHGGNFYGGHVCFAMDALKSAVASVADLLDRQLVLLCTPETSDGLPENLVAVCDGRRFAHHGFKAMQISASALTAEALKLTVPAAAFSRSTESHNQDKVSMGTIAARDCVRILELSEGVAGILLLACVQAVELRVVARATLRSVALRDAVRAQVTPLEEDRPQDGDLERVLALHRSGSLPIPGSPAFRADPGVEGACPTDALS